MERTALADDILQRFLRYVAVDTMSDPHVTDRHPSTEGQMELLTMVSCELSDAGVVDQVLDPNGFLVARIPSNLSSAVPVPTIAFMAHVDVADDVPGNQVKARVIDSYDGGDIRLDAGISITTSENSELRQYAGQTLVVTDGRTLLGSDDKAGVAILVSVARMLAGHSTIPHGEVEFVFTTDEETGHGMDLFSTELLRAVCAYTVDGGNRGEVEAECFNAATVELDFTGIPCHLGAARGKMVNSVTMAVSFLSMLPASESPEATDGRYGYYSAQEIAGTGERTHVVCYVRDFEASGLERRVANLQNLAKTVERMYHGGSVDMHVSYVYRNMFEAIRKDARIMDAVRDAARKIELPLNERIIRGGTDGARLAEMGIPAPNLFTGGHNLHSTREWAALSAMVDSAELVGSIIEWWAGERS